MELGIRQLKNELSEVLRAVKGGENVTITERGTAIARIVPIGLESSDARLARLIKEGRIKPAKNPKRKELPKPIVLPGKPVTWYILDERGRFDEE